MPAIRDARGQLHVHEVQLPVNPPGPIERSRVSEARLADFAAERAAATERRQRRHDAEGRPERSYVPTPVAREQAKRNAQASMAASRARGAQRAGFVKGATRRSQEDAMPTAPAPRRRQLSPGRTQPRAERVQRILAAIRESASHAEAAERLGMGKHAVEMFVSDLRRRRELPDDVEQLLRARNPAYGKAGRPRANGVERIEGGEEGAPATAAVAVEQPERDGSTVGSTPLSPFDGVLRLTKALNDIVLERARQERIGQTKRAVGIDWRSCADPQMAGGDDKRAAVLGEEFGEVCRAVLEAGYGADDDAHLRQELVEVAAVAVAWVEAIDARMAAVPA